MQYSMHKNAIQYGMCFCSTFKKVDFSQHIWVGNCMVILNTIESKIYKTYYSL